MDEERINNSQYNRNFPESTSNQPSGIAGGTGTPGNLGGQSPYQGGSTYGGQQSQGGSQRRKSFQDSSPDEVREMMKERVAKGIAAVTGVLEGFIERSRQGDVAGKTREALHEAGHTTREAMRSTSEEMDRTRQTAKEEGIANKAKDAMHRVGETARSVSQTTREEVSKTREKLSSSKGGSQNQGSSSGSQSSSGVARGMPDLRHTELGTQEDINKKERRL